MDKKHLRQLVISERSAMPNRLKADKSKEIFTKLLTKTEIISAKAVACYLDFRGEVETHDLIQALLDLKIAVYLPRLIPGQPQMQFYEVCDLNDLITNHFGIKEPDPSRCHLADLSHLSVVITPGVAFTKTGYRLGYGGGYYDRFFNQLSDHILRIGICFDMQIVESIPIERHDIPLHQIVTESQDIMIHKLP